MDGEPVRQIDAPVDLKRAAFTEFYCREVERLTRHVVKVTGATVHEAADAAQSALAEVWEKWDTVSNPCAWVRTVATREFYRALPDRRTAAGYALLSDEDVVEPGERWESVVVALAELPMMQRQVLAMTADGFSDEEIAAELRTSRQAVRQNRSRGRKALVGVLGREEQSDA